MCARILFKIFCVFFVTAGLFEIANATDKPFLEISQGIDPSAIERALRNRPKMVEINGTLATDREGYLTMNPDFYMTVGIRRTVEIEINAGRGNPLDRIPKRPGMLYPYWDYDRFSFPAGHSDQWHQNKNNPNFR